MPRVSIDHIAIDPDYCGGKPRIAGTRMPVVTIAQLHLSSSADESVSSEDVLTYNRQSSLRKIP